MTEQEEIWASIPFSNGKYEASNFGRIKSFYGKTERILSPGDNGSGYLTVLLSIDGKHIQKLVHRLVYEAHNGSIPDGMDIDHIDGCRTNNALSNLRILNRRDNVTAGYDRLRAAGKTSSIYPGVSRVVICGNIRYKVTRYIDGKYRHVGYYECEHIAGYVSKLASEGIYPIAKPKAIRVPPLIQCSKYKGVSFHKPTCKWSATLYVEKKNHTLGYFDTEDEAYAEVLKFKEFVKNGTFFLEREKSYKRKPKKKLI